VADAIDACAVEEGVRGPVLGLKWPNDLMLGDLKVGGILCELAGKGVLVAGVGLNVHQLRQDFPTGLRGEATSLEMALGIHLSRSQLMGRILREIRSQLGGKGETLAPAELKAYGARDSLKGRNIVSETSGKGRGMGLSPEGHLLLGTEDGGLCRVRAGSVRLENIRRETS
jgi:BirA family biotin operon repressor/biotin-[acetyl-CoA-carboxylase] ligase